MTNGIAQVVIGIALTAAIGGVAALNPGRQTARGCGVPGAARGHRGTGQGAGPETRQQLSKLTSRYETLLSDAQLDLKRQKALGRIRPSRRAPRTEQTTRDRAGSRTQFEDRAVSSAFRNIVGRAPAHRHWCDGCHRHDSGDAQHRSLHTDAFLNQENMVKANPKLTVAAIRPAFFAVAVPVMHARGYLPGSSMQDGDTAGAHFFKNYAVWQSPLTATFARFLAQGTPHHGLTLKILEGMETMRVSAQPLLSTMIASIRFSPEARGRSGAAIAAFEET